MSSELTRGTLVGGKFEITEKLGEGGMGSVYAGLHVDLRQRVAIKVILAGEINDEMMKRFRREALVLAQLESEHAVRVFDYGTLPDGSPYLVMEFLKGMDLQAYVDSRGPITVEEAAEIGTSVCDALADAHAKGIVHRDLKPSNLFLVDRPNGRRFIKVLDFGLSLFRAGDGDNITKTHGVLGTPLYAAPELFNAAREADGRADIWSLGASLYELVTGRVPFPAQTLAELATKLREGAPPASSINARVSGAFSDVLARCLRRPLGERFATALALRQELKRFRSFGKSSALFGEMSDAERAAFAVTDDAQAAVGTTEETVALATTETSHLANDAVRKAGVQLDDPQRTPKLVRAPQQPQSPPARTERSRAWYFIGGGVVLSLAAAAALVAATSLRVPNETRSITRVNSAEVPASSVPTTTSTAGLAKPTPQPSVAPTASVASTASGAAHPPALTTPPPSSAAAHPTRVPVPPPPIPPAPPTAKVPSTPPPPVATYVPAGPSKRN